MKLPHSFLSTVVALAAATLAHTAGAQETIKLFNLLELSGPTATAGTNYRNGVEMAVKEINDAGGVLGRKFDLTTVDNQSNPGVAKGLVSRAVDMQAFAVVGPTLSGAMVVSMNETRRAEIPNFTGAAAAAITQQGNPFVIRTNNTQSSTMPKVARYLKETLKAQTVDFIWVNSDFGKGGRDEFLKAAQSLGLKVAADVSTDIGQIDFSSPVVKVKQSGADALFVYISEEESARVLRELRKQGYSKPIVGDTTLVSQKVIELAGDAANGVRGHVPLTADAPTPGMKAFDQKYQQLYKVRSDHNGIQGYMVPYIIKTVSEKIGKVDSKAFAAALRGMPLTVKDTPGLLMDMKFDNKGDVDRISYLVEIKDGKQQILTALPPAQAF